MNINTFFRHYSLGENPFSAEEARLDPVFGRVIDTVTHPDFPKILGKIDRPSTAVVFGEKGSGKTALRILIGEQVARHNKEHPDKCTLLVAYDNFNPYLDNLLRVYKQDEKRMLNNYRLEDHQDAILSIAVTRLVKAILGEDDGSNNALKLPDNLSKTFKNMDRQSRVDLAALAGLYYRPESGGAVNGWQKLRHKLKLGLRLPLKALRYMAGIVTIITVGLGMSDYFISEASRPWWLLPAFGIFVGGAILCWGYWILLNIKLWLICRRATSDMYAINRSTKELGAMFTSLRHKDLASQPLPHPVKSGQGNYDSRYQLTRRLVNILRHLGYGGGVMVLVDRVDEPSIISGDATRMKSIIWPMFDNKFLQQESIGFKLLLPLELRYLLNKEDPQFFQEARLDKQNMIDRLSWSGVTLYDLCSARLRACRPEGKEPIYLTDLFAEDVSREMLVDALDQMHQPRDGFKFLYAVIQEHCRLVPEDNPDCKIARLTLESVRRSQSQRVQELYRGLSPT